MSRVFWGFHKLLLRLLLPVLLLYYCTFGLKGPESHGRMIDVLESVPPFPFSLPSPPFFLPLPNSVAACLSLSGGRNYELSVQVTKPE